MPEKKNTAWSWIPTLYFAQGLPYVIVMTVAVIMFKRLGMPNADIALYTSGLYLPWVIKPLWSPLVDLLKTKRWWIVAMQLVMGAGFAGIALTLEAPDPFRYCLAFLWLLAFSSATHDIAADGFYMLALDERRQAYFVGIRNTFYRLAWKNAMPPPVRRQEPFRRLGQSRSTWQPAFSSCSSFTTTCSCPTRQRMPFAGKPGRQNHPSAKSFCSPSPPFSKRKASSLPWRSSCSIALPSRNWSIASPFLLDAPAAGGLGLDTSTVGFIYGTVGVIALTAGGILGGIFIARRGLRKSLWQMVCAMNLPNLVYLYLAYAHPESETVISACVAVEQLGYGFGFTALTYFMMLFSAGKQQTAHYALCTGFMALGMMLPGMVSGWIQELIGYRHFFLWIMLATLPSFLATQAIARHSALRASGKGGTDVA